MLSQSQEDTLLLKGLSPLDSRYYHRLAGLANFLSEWALFKYRLHVEVEWLITLSDLDPISDMRSLSESERNLLHLWVTSFDEEQAQRVKAIEAITKHDVKAVEYYLKERLAGTSLRDVCEFVHFCCTSEDINNLAYGLMLKGAVERQWTPLAQRLVETVAVLAEGTRGIPMLSHTHGQRATPTTVGKELAVFVRRWRRQLDQLSRAEYLGKFNGAVGSYSAHAIAYPKAPWLQISQEFVERLGLRWNPLTTQIEPHDYMAEIFHGISRFNTILANFDADMWHYISLDYFRQRPVHAEVGSSTMPHKINPIDFENSEANTGLSNALLTHLANKLPVSRLQRDLSDSSALRNVGVALAHSLVAIGSTLEGLSALEVHEERVSRDLSTAWEVLGEAVQIVMRKNGLDAPYERIKALTRGTEVTRDKLRSYLEKLDIPEPDRTRLMTLEPAGYIGLANELVSYMSQD